MRTRTRELRAGLNQLRIRMAHSYGVPLERRGSVSGRTLRQSLATSYREGRLNRAGAKRERAYIRNAGLN